MKKLITIITAILIFPVSMMAAPVGIIIHYSGNVQIMKNDGKTYSISKKDLQTPKVMFEEGDHIITSKNSVAQLEFASGVSLRVGPSTSVRANSKGFDFAKPGEGKKVNLDLEKGELFSSIEKRISADEYQVTTPTSIAAVRGTFFRIAASSNESVVTVEDGAVEMSTSDGASSQVIEKNKTANVAKGSVLKVKEATLTEMNRIRQIRNQMEKIREDYNARKDKMHSDFDSIRSGIRGH